MVDLILSVFALISLFLALMWYRVEWVFDERIRLIHNYPLCYVKLWSHNKMLWHFWIWDINKMINEQPT